MKWSDFKDEKKVYLQLWDKLKKGHSGDIRKFLDKSYMVVFYHPKQISLGADALSLAKDNSEFFVPDKYGKEYVDLVSALKKVEKDSDSAKKDRIFKRISAFEVAQLSVVDHRFEIRFPSVDIDIIQKIKQSKYCDQELTDMSMVSIRVILS